MLLGLPVLDSGACDGVLIHALNLQGAATRDKSGMFAWVVRKGYASVNAFAEVQPVWRLKVLFSSQFFIKLVQFRL